VNEEDDNSKLTITQYKAAGAAVESNENVYLRYDFQSAFISASDVYFEVYLDSGTEVGGCSG